MWPRVEKGRRCVTSVDLSSSKKRRLPPRCPAVKKSQAPTMLGSVKISTFLQQI